jgi:ABC-type antimicrobial peptide transport system permease subunit
MLKNFFKIAVRNLNRNKGFSLLNISGLALGMASALLILLWVHSELTYDSFYKKSDRLYQAWNRNKGNNGLNCWNNTTKPLGPVLKKDYPEIEQTTRVNWDASILFTVGEKRMNITGTMVDPDFLTMFDVPFLSGNIHTALNRPNDIVISEKTAKSLFGTTDAVGKTLLLDSKYNFAVSAVMQNLPSNSDFHYDFLLPWSYMSMTNQDDSSWGNNSTHNFVLLKPNANLAQVNEKIKDVVKIHGDKGWTTQEFLYPVSRLHLYANFVNGVESGGKIEMVKVFILIAIFLLLIACINFMNMSTARSEQRAKEVGIRKVAGALKGSLIMQFIAESILITFIAAVFALVIVELCLPAFNTLTSKNLFIEFGNIYFWLTFIGFIVFTGVLAGSYPAFFLSSFKPVTVLKGSFRKSEALVTPRKVLVVMQFSFAIILIVSTIIIQQQIKYAQSRETGYDKNKLVYVFLSGDINKNYKLITNELLSKGIAESVTKTSAPMTEGWSSGGADWEGKNPNDRTGVNYFNSDGHLVKTAGLTLVEGRDMDIDNFPTDTFAVILNQSAVKLMGFKHPVGQTINHAWHVIGVVKDFILESPYQPVTPMIIQGPAAGWFNLIHIKLNNEKPIAENMAAMEKVFKTYNPNYPFEPHFIDEQYAKKFNDDKTTGTLTGLFSGLTIFISCLGLFGLAAYMAEKRVKEIGVRKVLGASVASITTLLSMDFIKLVIISIFIASPLALFAMNKWLSAYDYKIHISPWIFFLAGFMAILIAICTVSFQAIRAAIANPVTSLRSE